MSQVQILSFRPKKLSFKLRLERLFFTIYVFAELNSILKIDKSEADTNALFYRAKRRISKMRLTWLNNEFICKDLYAPFKINKDSDYIDDLKSKYDIVMNQAKNSGADDESMRIIADFSAKILKSLDYICFIKKSQDLFRTSSVISHALTSRTIFPRYPSDFIFFSNFASGKMPSPIAHPSKRGRFSLIIVPKGLVLQSLTCE